MNESLVRAKQLKDQGNEAYRRQDRSSAVYYYTKALELLTSSYDETSALLLYQLHLNRSKSYFYLNEYALAFFDLFAMIDVTEFQEPVHCKYAFKVAAQVREWTTFNFLKSQLVEKNWMENWKDEERLDILRTMDELSATRQVSDYQANSAVVVSAANFQRKHFCYRFNRDLFASINAKIAIQEQNHIPRVNTIRLESMKSLVMAQFPLVLRQIPQTAPVDPGGLTLCAHSPIRKAEMFLSQPPIVYCSFSDQHCEDCGFRFRGNLSHTKVVCQDCGLQFCSQACYSNSLDQYHRVMCEQKWNYKELKQIAVEQGKSLVSRLPACIMKLMAKSMQLNLANPLEMTQMAQLAPNRVFLEHALCLPVRMNQYNQLVDAMHWQEHDRKRMDLAAFDFLCALLLNNMFFMSSSGVEDSTQRWNHCVLYHFPSFINHSCSPNTDYSINPGSGGPHIQLSARQNIAPSSQITISYVDSTANKTARQTALKQYGFQCRCERCVSS